MNFRGSLYDGDQTNVNRMWQLKAQRTHHLKNLQTIYKDKQIVRFKSEKDHLKRIKQLDEYRKKKQSSSNRRNKSMQQRINYQNAILRNKILDALQENKRTSNPNRIDRTNPFRTAQQQQMYQTNMKMGQRLSSMRSQINSKINFKEHEKMAQQYSMMIQKKSPKKKAYLKSLTNKRIKGISILPEIDDISYSQY